MKHSMALMMLLLAAFAAAQLDPNNPCLYTDPDSGAKYDLSTMNTADPGKDFTVTAGGNVYAVSVCKNFTNGCEDSDRLPAYGIAFQSFLPDESDGICKQTLGRLPGAQWSVRNADKPGAGVDIRYGGGSPCSGAANTPPLVTTLHIVCDASMKKPKLQFKAASECAFEFTITGAAGCGQLPAALSAAGQVSVLFLSFFAAYLLIGICYKQRALGTSGIESVPNIDFWRAVGVNFKAGLACTWATLTRRRVSKSAGLSDSLSAHDTVEYAPVGTDGASKFGEEI